MALSRVLFLCTGNYYRSRFAEVVWNHLEREAPSGWQADSRGLYIALGAGNVGPISVHTIRGLQRRGIDLPRPIRSPLQVELSDFTAHDRVVAMSASEHRKMVADQFPRWADSIDYWDIEDLPLCEPETALSMLEGRIRELRTTI
jgi:protein-tyrosine phosphatase